MIDTADRVPSYLRLRAFYLLIAFFFSLLVVRLWFLQIVKGPELADQAAMQRTRLIRRVAARGTIVDAEGHVLAASRYHHVISVVPYEVRRAPAVLTRLAAMLHSSVEALAETISENQTTPFDPVPVASDVDVALLSQIEEQKLDLPGVLVTRDPVRLYNDSNMYAHILGTTGPINRRELDRLRPVGYRGGDYVGKSGVEEVYERDLRGRDGGQRIAVDARGRMQHGMDEIRPRSGHTLHLTVLRDVQRAAYIGLQEQLARGKPGAAVAIDPNNGAVLALASTPSYELNKYTTNFPALLTNRLRPLLNRAAQGKYACGSTFKLITAAAGLETGSITPASSDYCPGSIRVGRRTFHCDKRSGHGAIGFSRALAASCNVYFFHVAQRVGVRRLAEWARKFGLGERTGIDLPVDARGTVPSVEWKKMYHKSEPWVPGDLLNMAIGQGYVRATPLQLATYTAAVANGGTLYQPTLVHDVADESGGGRVVLRGFTPKVRGHLGMSPSTQTAIVQGMVAVMERGGTAYGLGIHSIPVAAKTGTAEVFINKKPASNSLFICFAPVDHPRIAIAVVVEGGGHGADSAGHIARRMLLAYNHLSDASTPLVSAAGD